jgi:hypothetical protein
MDEHEPEQMQDDEEVEITDLDEDEAGAPPHGMRRVARLASLPLDGRLRRYRRPLAFVTAALVLLAALVVLFDSGPLSSLLPGAGGGQSAQPTQQSSFTYVVQANPPWGHLLVDGHRVRPEPVGSLQSLTLSAGRHELEWIAPPFRTQQCVLVTPPGSGKDTCNHPEFFESNRVRVGSVIVFQASLNLLASAQRSSLIQLAQDALNQQRASGMVQPGEAYAISSLAFQAQGKPCVLTQDQSAAICYEIARQPLQATVSFQLDTDTSSSGPCLEDECHYNGEDCRLFCDAPLYEIPGIVLPTDHWNTFAIAHILWQYRTLQGQPVVPVETDSFIWGQQDEHLVPLSITWDGSTWQVTTEFHNVPYMQIPYGDPMCDAAQVDIGTLLFGDARATFEFEDIPEQNFALGCLLQVTEVTLPETPTPEAVPPVATFLHRFGVLVAVNNEAHRLLPFLPVADAYERHLVQQFEG